MSWSGSPGLALLMLSLALVLWPGARTRSGSRLTLLTVGAAVAAPAPSDDVVGFAARRPAIFAGVAGAAVFACFPSMLGALIAALVAAGSYVLMFATSPSGGPGSRSTGWGKALRWTGRMVGRDAAAEPGLPLAIDLLAVCLRAGMPTSAAFRSVARTVSSSVAVGRTGSEGPRVDVVLGRVAAACELGSEPATAWQEWIGSSQYGRLARALVVTGESGSAVAGRLEAVSEQLRTAAGEQALVRSQRAGVALMAPLGLCFLPAFVCLGVLPVVIGIAGRVFG